MEQGQAMLIHVGTSSDLPEKPHDFPRCGSWPSANYKKVVKETVEEGPPKQCVSHVSGIHEGYKQSYLLVSMVSIIVIIIDLVSSK